MSTDPISEARDAFERAIQNHLLAYAYPAHNPAEVAEKLGEAEARYIALRAAILAADPRRAALEELAAANVEYWDGPSESRIDRVLAALKALEETAVEETRS